MREEKIESADGTGIFVRSWASTRRPRAVVVICHGVNSHSGQTLWPAGHFAMAGFAPCALDLRGRGKSDGERFHVAHISE